MSFGHMLARYASSVRSAWGVCMCKEPWRASLLFTARDQKREGLCVNAYEFRSWLWVWF